MTYQQLRILEHGLVTLLSQEPCSAEGERAVFTYIMP